MILPLAREIKCTNDIFISDDLEIKWNVEQLKINYSIKENKKIEIKKEESSTEMSGEIIS